MMHYWLTVVQLPSSTTSSCVKERANNREGGSSKIMMTSDSRPDFSHECECISHGLADVTLWSTGKRHVKRFSWTLFFQWIELSIFKSPCCDLVYCDLVILATHSLPSYLLTNLSPSEWKKWFAKMFFLFECHGGMRCVLLEGDVDFDVRCSLVPAVFLPLLCLYSGLCLHHPHFVID